MISTDFLQICNRENEPIVRQGQRKRRRRKHYHAPAKQDASKQPPLDCKSDWHGNVNTQPSKTLRLRNEITRNAATDTVHARAQRIQRSKTHRRVTFCDNPNGTATFCTCERLRTLSDAFERSRTQRTRPYPQTPRTNGNPSLRIVSHGVALGPPPSQFLRWHNSPCRSLFFFLMLLVWAHLQVKFLDVILPHVDHLFSLSWCWFGPTSKSDSLMSYVPMPFTLFFRVSLAWAHLQVKFLDVILPHVENVSCMSCIS